jgi:nitrous oxide reductase accessory protein NosL
MFKYILNMVKYEQKHTSDDIAAIWVKDFASGKWLDGRKAVYVVGSKVMGPMGKELIPFNNGGAAGQFKTANEGMIKHFADISMGDIKKLGMGGMKMKGKMKGEM